MSQDKYGYSNNKIDPNISEREWYALALAGAVITFVIAAFCLLWIFYGGSFDGIKDIKDIKNRIAISGMIVTFCGVATTFCTVVWRGLISTEQVAETKKQIIITEENNLASILQKGAEFIEDGEKPSKVSAGLASLHSVLLSKNEMYSSAAESLLVEYLTKHGSFSHDNQSIITTIKILRNHYYRNNKPLDYEVYFSLPTDNPEPYLDDYITNWIVDIGFKECGYTRGDVIKQNLNISKLTKIKFREVNFYECTIIDVNNVDFESCCFYECKIKQISIEHINNNVFDDCNFTGCIFIGGSEINKGLVEEGNYFYSYFPPLLLNSDDEIIWGDYFIEINKDDHAES